MNQPDRISDAINKFLLENTEYLSVRYNMGVPLLFEFKEEPGIFFDCMEFLKDSDTRNTMESLEEIVGFIEEDLYGL